MRGLHSFGKKLSEYPAAYVDCPLVSTSVLLYFIREQIGDIGADDIVRA